MRKKVLMISICLGVVLSLGIGGVIVVNQIKEDPGTAYLKITALPTKIVNVVVPPPKLEKKTPEKRKKVVSNLLREYEDAGQKWQIYKSIELWERILKMGNPIVPVLVEIIRDSNEKGDVRKNAASMIEQIVDCQRYSIKEWEERQGKQCVGIWEKSQKIDTKEITSMLIKALKDNDVATKEYVVDVLGKVGDERAVVPIIKVVQENSIGRESARTLLMRLKDRRIAEILDKNGTNYEVWIEADRARAIKGAMDALKKNPNDKEAIRVLGLAKAEEAVPMLVKMLEREKELDRRCQVMEMLGKIGTKEAVDALIHLLSRLKEDDYRGGGI